MDCSVERESCCPFLKFCTLSLKKNSSSVKDWKLLGRILGANVKQEGWENIKIGCWGFPSKASCLKRSSLRSQRPERMTGFEVVSLFFLMASCSFLAHAHFCHSARKQLLSWNVKIYSKDTCTILLLWFRWDACLFLAEILLPSMSSKLHSRKCHRGKLEKNTLKQASFPCCMWIRTDIHTYMYM